MSEKTRCPISGIKCMDCAYRVQDCPIGDIVNALQEIATALTLLAEASENE